MLKNDASLVGSKPHQRLAQYLRNAHYNGEARGSEQYFLFSNRHLSRARFPALKAQGREIYAKMESQGRLGERLLELPPSAENP